MDTHGERRTAAHCGTTSMCTAAKKRPQAFMARHVKSPRRALRWLRGAFGRVVTLLLLLLATPGAADFAAEIVSLVSGDRCCEAPCSPSDAQSCPESCIHCLSCAHPNALPAMALLTPIDQPPSAAAFQQWRARPYASGYRSPPFRPPAA
jgi:hypothetical protein